MYFRPITLALALAVPAAAALAHNHLTVDTAGGNPGDRIVLRAGYYPTEPTLSIAQGRLLDAGLAAVYDAPDALPAGPNTGWFASDELLLTSDYFLATGRLNGGDFRFEIRSIVRLAGAPASVVWGDFDENFVFAPSASSAAGTRDARSFAVGLGGHDHEQGSAFSAAGVYDVTFVAWDASGRYTDSAPVTVRFRTGNGCLADFNGDGARSPQDIFEYLNAYFAGGPSADTTGLNGRTPADIFAFLNAYFTGCP